MPLRVTDPETLALGGCKLATPPELFVLLMAETRNEPCLTGCVYLEGGKCSAYQKFHTKPMDEAAARKRNFDASHSDQSGLVGGRWAGMTIRQIAAKEGISLNQARQRKQDGHYRE